MPNELTLSQKAEAAWLEQYTLTNICEMSPRVERVIKAAFRLGYMSGVIDVIEINDDEHMRGL